jgi:hypothetical protein
MKRGASPPRSALARTRLRGVLRLLLAGLVLLCAAPAWIWLAIMYSGELVLAQKVGAAQALRGFDFGPVYLQQDVRQRYFIRAVVPEGTGGVWRSSFEVLDSQKQPVFRQDELRFIGDWQFAAGQRDSCAKAFTLEQATGYYYFRFTPLNGDYASRGLSPVVEFAVRQHVLDGWGLWLPGALLALGGLLCWLLVWRQVSRIGAAETAVDQPVRERPGRVLRPTGPRRAPRAKSAPQH